jgi:hypothetical protein
MHWTRLSAVYGDSRYNRYSFVFLYNTQFLASPYVSDAIVIQFMLFKISHSSFDCLVIKSLSSIENFSIVRSLYLFLLFKSFTSSGVETCTFVTSSMFTSVKIN